MKRLALYLASALLSLMLVCLAGLFWLAGTTAGSRFAVARLAGASGLQVSVGGVEGRILDRLHLTGVRIGRPGLQVQIDAVEIAWVPRRLFNSIIEVTELSLTGVRVQDDSPAEAAPQPTWPRVSAGMSAWRARIARLKVTGLSYRKLAAKPLLVTELTGEGSVTLDTAEPVFSLAVNVADLDVANELKVSTRLFGTLTLSGKPSGFSGTIALANRAPGWRTAEVTADFRGTTSGLTLDPVAGAILEGRLTGAVAVAWAHGLQVSGTLAGRKLNPGAIAADWSGLVNFDIAGNIDLPDQGEAHGAVRGKLLESRLHGQDLQGEVAAAGTGKQLRIDRLVLSGRGFDLHGAGVLDQRIDLTARVSDLSRLLPGATGKLEGDGWVRWRDGIVSGGGTGAGSNLAAAGMRVGGVRFNAGFGSGAADQVSVDAFLSRLQFGKVRVESASLSLAGTTARHTARAALSAPGGEAQIDLSGGYAGGIWRGVLTRLTGRDGVGPVSLAAPAPLTLGAGALQLESLVLNGLPDERVEISGSLNRQPLSIVVKADWRGVNLERANFWSDAVKLAGGSSGNASLRVMPGEPVLLFGRTAAQGTLVAQGSRVSVQQLAATLDGDGQGVRAGIDLVLKDSGGEAHLLFASTAPALLSLPDSGNLKLQWSDVDLALLRPVLPSNLAAAGRLTGRATGNLLPGGGLDLDGITSLANGHISWRGEEDAFEASIDTAELALGWSGGFSPTAQGRGRLRTATAQVAATGVYTGRGKRITLGRSTLRVDADQRGLRAWLELAFEKGGSVSGAFSTAAPLGPVLPESGEFTVKWRGIDPLLVQAWLPGALSMEGLLDGQAHGKLLPEQRLEIAGEALASPGAVQWLGDAGEMTANLRSASLSFSWRGESLSGATSLALAEYGKGQGTFSLPIPARLPVVVNRDAPLQGTFVGTVQERGFLTALFPRVVRESHGNLDVKLDASGTLNAPRLTGNVSLSRAGAYLPTAGILVSDVQFNARLTENQLRIEDFRAVSGEGHIEGTLSAQLGGWQVTGYNGTLNGERFMTISNPELRVLSSPRLSFTGKPGHITVSGELLIPEMQITGTQINPVVTTSEDVIREGAPTTVAGKTAALAIDGQVHLLLGDKVFMKTAGIDAQLGGSMDLVLDGLKNISSRGEIRVVKGRYRAYGMELEIERGRLYYAGGQIDQPNLDILALRNAGTVRAGVTVAGLLNAPIVKLYAEPSLPDVDILAYMVLGHPLGSSAEQANMVALAASSLFALGEANSLQNQIKRRLGLSVIGLETVNTSSPGQMGYQVIPVTPTGAAQAQPGIGETLVTVGKYLTPKLYLSYGRSLSTGGNLFQLRYDILRHWQLEVQSGTASGGDLFYKLEFN